MALEPVVAFIVGHRSDVLSVAALAISWRAHRLAKASERLKRPYLSKSSYQWRETLALAGQDADHWEIASVRLIWPLTAQFMSIHTQHDAGGSILNESRTPIGRKLPASRYRLMSSDPSRPTWLLVRSRSKASRQCFKYQLVRVTQ